MRLQQIHGTLFTGPTGSVYDATHVPVSAFKKNGELRKTIASDNKFIVSPKPATALDLALESAQSFDAQAIEWTQGMKAIRFSAQGVSLPHYPDQFLSHEEVRLESQLPFNFFLPDLYDDVIKSGDSELARVLSSHSKVPEWVRADLEALAHQHHNDELVTITTVAEVRDNLVREAVDENPTARKKARIFSRLTPNPVNRRAFLWEFDRLFARHAPIASIVDKFLKKSSLNRTMPVVDLSTEESRMNLAQVQGNYFRDDDYRLRGGDPFSILPWFPRKDALVPFPGSVMTVVETRSKSGFVGEDLHTGKRFSVPVSCIYRKEDSIDRQLHHYNRDLRGGHD